VPASARSVGVGSHRRQILGFVMGWSEADGDALFRHPPDEQVDDDASSVFDGGREAMRRLRFPFEANPADVVEQDQAVPLEDDEYRG